MSFNGGLPRGQASKALANADLGTKMCHERPELQYCTMFTRMEALFRGLKDIQNQWTRFRSIRSSPNPNAQT
jgi:hypothetical protein